MTCPNCSAELPELALTCTRCGASVRSTSFSYLPAGTPPWPTTNPQNMYALSGTRSSFNAPLQELVHAEKLRSTERSRGSTRSILPAILLLVITPLLGVILTLGVLYTNGQFATNKNSTTGTNNQTAAQPTPQPTATTQLNPGTLKPISTTSSTALSISMQYPSNWNEDTTQATNTSPYVVFSPQTADAFFIVRRFSSTLSAQFTSADNANQTIFSVNFQDPTTSQHIHNFKIVTTSNPNPTIGGAQWTQSEAEYTNDGGTLIHVVSIAVQHKSIYYTFFISTSKDAYTQLLSQVFQPMFDSFNFLS